MSAWRRESEQRPKSPDAPKRGRPLDPAVRGRMEARLGHDFSTVRVHHGPEAKALHARAFTVGEDVTFAPGQFAPGTRTGDELLAHELGHVVDARHGTPPGAYRAPDDGPLPTGAERPLPVPRRPIFQAGSLSLSLGVLDGFAFNGFDLTTDHRKQVADIANQLVSLMLNQPTGRITITGHTDLVGAEQGNVELGRKRAVAVAAALAELGVPARMMDVSSAGESAPVVQTEEREPRNRRVEVRFGGGPIGTEGEGWLRLGEPAKPPILFPPTVTPPPAKPPWWQQPTPQPAPAPSPSGTPQPAPGSTGPTTKEGSAGDIAKAVAATPQGKKLIEAAETQGKKDLGKLSTPEKVLVGTVVGAEAAGVVAGLAHDPAARKEVLDFIDGKEIPVPWTKGTVKIVPHTKGGNVGGVVSFDIIKIFGGGKK
jgi:outer membrane protein OmpA-like peptidoglycan-associated protein